MKRRDVLKAALALPALSAAAQASAATTRSESTPLQPTPDRESMTADYVVVGSGAGGGTVAARLAEAGYSVLVLEAGGNPPDTEYEVPALHPRATESAAMRWDFFVRHYSDAAKEEGDPNYVKAERGFWYPRAGVLGGCTAHNAMIFVAPSNRDWDELADLTGDPSWRADKMRTYFQRLENCRHRPVQRAGRGLANPSRHGYAGWLPTEKALPREALRDRKVHALIHSSLRKALDEVGAPSPARLLSMGDPNDWRVLAANEFGTCYTPLTTLNHQRVGTRERLLEVQRRYPDRLTIELDALAARVLFDESDRTRAIGVEYLKGERLYQAHATPSSDPGRRRTALARREVILAGGAFNTPQLLMLSGIGAPDVLSRCGVPLRLRLDNVGKRLQDRYEVAVVNRMEEDWDALRGATFSADDAQYRQWKAKRTGAYISNGVPLCVIARSSAAQPSPDLFCYALLGDFRGYRPGYADVLPKHLNYLTWVVLKGHTTNLAGEVTLTSADPRVRPAINFKYFDDGVDASGSDVDAVVKGVSLVRRMTSRLASELGFEEQLPGPAYDTDDKLRDFVRTHAWGHHASCSCGIGSRERGGVLSSDFKVHDTTNLRVVDASVFPRVPGLFIVSAVYMIGEKAADVILADAKR